MRELMTTGQVARQLGVPRWRLLYWLDRQKVEEPALIVPGRRLFTWEEVERIRRSLGLGAGTVEHAESSEHRPTAGSPCSEERNR